VEGVSVYFFIAVVAINKKNTGRFTGASPSVQSQIINRKSFILHPQTIQKQAENSNVKSVCSPGHPPGGSQAISG
jgi:hypothetical protein